MQIDYVSPTTPYFQMMGRFNLGWVAHNPAVAWSPKFYPKRIGRVAWRQRVMRQSAALSPFIFKGLTV